MMDFHPEFPENRSMPDSPTHEHDEGTYADRDPVEGIHKKKVRKYFIDIRVFLGIYLEISENGSIFSTVYTYFSEIKFI